MGDSARPIAWLPVVVTIGLWLLGIGLFAAFVSNTWADLVGLLSLPAAPVVYRTLTAAVGDDPERVAVDTAATRDPGVRPR